MLETIYYMLVSIYYMIETIYYIVYYVYVNRSPRQFEIFCLQLNFAKKVVR